MTDDLTRRIIARSLDADHQQLLQDAQRIAASLNAYVTEPERNPPGSSLSGVSLAGEVVRIGTYLIQHARDAARYDGARDMAHTLLGAADSEAES